MKITVKNKVLHESPFQSTNNEDVDVLDSLKKVLSKKGENLDENINKVDDKTIELKELDSMSLHSFVLEMEKIGKNVEFEKSITLTVK